MPFTSVGYDGTVDELQWARLIPSAGSSTYGVLGAGDLKVTAVAGAPLTVSVAPGTAWGHGVMDAITTNTTIECDPITSGSRWDLIAVRRNWQPLAGGPTSVVKVTGTAAQAIPGGRLVGPGVEDDQPLALVKWTAGQTQPTSIIDIRCWATNGGMVARDELAKSYLNKLGAAVYIDGTVWRYVPGLNDLPEWITDGSASLSPLGVAGYAITGKVSVEPVGSTRKRVTVDLNVTRSGANIIIGTDFSGLGSFIPVAARGDADPKYLPIALSGGSGGNNGHATAFLNPASGLVMIRSQGNFTWTTGALFSLNCVYYI